MTGRGGRALWRLAWRAARAQPGRHLLIVVLLALAVAGSASAAIGARTVAPPPELTHAATFGSAELVVQRWTGGVSYDELPSELQREVDARHGGPLDAVSVAEVDARVRAEAPAGAVIAITEEKFDSLADTTDGRSIGEGRVVVADPTAPALAGLFVGDVATAPGPGEVLVAPALLQDAGLSVGEQIRIGSLEELRIIGVASAPDSLSRPAAILGPGTELGGRTSVSWYVGGIDHETADGMAANLGASVQTADPQAEQEAHLSTMTRSTFRAGTPPLPAAVGSLVAVVLLVQVGFVAAAAFATGTRRRVREFGLMAVAAGADPGHVRGAVRREALVLGLAGAGLGAMVGLIGVRLGMPLLERVADRPLVSLEVSPVDMLLPATLAIVASLAAAWMPARTTASVPLMAALAGRVPLRRVARWVVPVSLVAAVLGLAGTARSMRSWHGGWYGGGAPSYTVLSSETPFGIAPQTLRTAVLIISVALLLAGIAGLSGPLIQTIGRLTGRLGIHGRLALRDSARQRTRSAATVTATMVVMAASVLGFVLTSSEDVAWASELDHLDDVVTVTGPAYGEGSLSPTPGQVAAVRSVLPEVASERPVEIVSEGWDDRVELVPRMEEVGADGFIGAPWPSRIGLDTPQLRTLLGVGETGPRTVTLNQTSTYGGSWSPGERFEAGLSVGGGPAVDVTVVVAPNTIAPPFPELLVPQAVVTDLGLGTLATFRLLELDRPVTVEHAEAAWEVADGVDLPFTIGVSWPSEPRGSGLIQLLLGGAGMLLALAIAAATAALGATESDHDLRTMSAVGADPRLRPRFRAVQAGYHVALGAVLAVPTGLLLAVVLLRSDQWGASVVSVPVLAIAGFVVVCPVIVAAPFLAFSRATSTRLPTRRVA